MLPSISSRQLAHRRLLSLPSLTTEQRIPLLLKYLDTFYTDIDAWVLLSELYASIELFVLACSRLAMHPSPSALSRSSSPLLLPFLPFLLFSLTQLHPRPVLSLTHAHPRPSEPAPLPPSRRNRLHARRPAVSVQELPALFELDREGQGRE